MARLQKDVFLVFPKERDLFSVEQPTFSTNKNGFGLKTHFSPRKKMVWTGKPIFSSENQTTSFSEIWPYHFPSCLDLFGCYSEKDGFRRKNRIFLEKNWFFAQPRESWYFSPRPNFSQQRACISCVVCARYELVLPIRFVECQHYWDSIPLSINQDIIRITFGVNGELVLQV